MTDSSASLHSVAYSDTTSKSVGSRRVPRMDVVPGKSLGPFELGAELHRVVAMVQGELPGVPAAESWAAGPLSDGNHRIVVDDVGVALTFSARTQRLAMIEACNLSAIELIHKQGLLCGKGATPTFVRLYDVLGPTFAGELDEATGEYLLTYSGLDVIFRIPAEFRQSFAKGEHPMTFSDGTTPVALGLIIREEVADGLCAPSLAPYAQPWSTVEVHWGRGVSLTPAQPRRSEHRKQDLLFGMAPQDVLSALGPPESKLVKGDERLMAADDDGTMPSVYCLGYPGYGLDAIFDASTDRLAKLILYTGVQGHEAYLRYARCHFEVPLVPDQTVQCWLGVRSDVPSDDVPASCVTPLTSWPTVQRWIEDAKAGPLPRPLLASTADGTLNLWAMNGVVFAVAQQSGAIVSLTLTPSSGCKLPRAQAASGGAAQPPLLAFRTPIVSAKPSPEARPTDPPLRHAVSGDFDDCADDANGADRQSISKFFLDGRAPPDAGPSRTEDVGVPQQQSVSNDGPSSRAGPDFGTAELGGGDSVTRYRFNYPGFVSAPEPLPPPMAADAGTNDEDPHATTVDDEDDNLDPPDRRSDERGVETDYADDAFESLQPTETQLSRHMDPTVTAVFGDDDPDSRPTHAPTTDDGQSSGSPEPEGAPDAVGSTSGSRPASGVAEPQDEADEDADGGVAAAVADEFVESERPAHDELDEGLESDPLTSEATTRDVTPIVADSESTPPVTPPMGPRSVPGALVVKKKTAKKKKGGRR